MFAAGVEGLREKGSGEISRSSQSVLIVPSRARNSLKQGRSTQSKQDAEEAVLGHE